MESDTAFRLLRAQRRGWYKQLTTRPLQPPRDGALLPRFECVWMPYYIVPVNVTSPKGPGVINVSIEGWSGGYALFERDPDLIDDDCVEGSVFSPRLGAEEAALLARRGLLATLMRKRGQRKPVITGAQETYVVHFPYWVYYYAPRAGRLDIKVVDAASGEIPGGRLRVSILEAFIAESQYGA